MAIFNSYVSLPEGICFTGELATVLITHCLSLLSQAFMFHHFSNVQSDVLLALNRSQWHSNPLSGEQFQGWLQVMPPVVLVYMYHKPLNWPSNFNQLSYRFTLWFPMPYIIYIHRLYYIIYHVARDTAHEISRWSIYSINLHYILMYVCYCGLKVSVNIIVGSIN